ncbi:hypothetical protein [Deinococcus piscis]|uniref:hypothetical protein n=1 Tax=Deinococcus piscis TaxID=394230 RepID=UPI0016791E75|nr:hypothetical protein [Deinococcus piscis]
MRKSWKTLICFIMCLSACAPAQADVRKLAVPSAPLPSGNCTSLEAQQVLDRLISLTKGRESKTKLVLRTPTTLTFDRFSPQPEIEVNYVASSGCPVLRAKQVYESPGVMTNFEPVRLWNLREGSQIQVVGEMQNYVLQNQLILRNSITLNQIDDWWISFLNDGTKLRGQISSFWNP